MPTVNKEVNEDIQTAREGAGGVGLESLRGKCFANIGTFRNNVAKLDSKRLNECTVGLDGLEVVEALRRLADELGVSLNEAGAGV